MCKTNENGSPKVWVCRAPDDAEPEYVEATEADILAQPCVVAAIEKARFEGKVEATRGLYRVFRGMLGQILGAINAAASTIKGVDSFVSARQDELPEEGS